MRAKDFKHGHRQVLAAAEDAQRNVIRTWLVDRYSSGPKIAEWNDHRFSIAWFNAGDVKAARPLTWASPATPRKYLNELAKGGFLSVKRWSGIVAFRFNREKCNAIAAKVLSELRAGPPVT